MLVQRLGDGSAHAVVHTDGPADGEALLVCQGQVCEVVVSTTFKMEVGAQRFSSTSLLAVRRLRHGAGLVGREQQPKRILLAPSDFILSSTGCVSAEGARPELNPCPAELEPHTRFMGKYSFIYNIIKCCICIY